MAVTTVDTDFAPAGRDDQETLDSLAAEIDQNPLFRELVNAVPSPVVVLNDNRQIVAANQAVLTLLEAEESDLRGSRIGEVVRCSNMKEGPDGCGTGVHCRACGAVAAILECQGSQAQTTNDCRLTSETGSQPRAIDVRVTASPFHVAANEFTLVVLEDIAKEKRLDVLTRTFFHDVLNTAGGIRGFAHLLEEDLPAGTSERDDARQLGSMAEKLIDEIECQRDLTRAEKGQLTVTPKPVRAAEMLSELRTLYAAHEVSAGRRIVLGACWQGSLLVDPRLLARVLGNMIKNAVEATPQGGRVVISCEDMGRRAAFRVTNPTVMPERVRLQIFQRSFSTKGEEGRGIGTYSIKLFGEIYLGGQVSFTSQEPEGTTFSIVLPKVRLDTLGGEE